MISNLLPENSLKWRSPAGMVSPAIGRSHPTGKKPTFFLGRPFLRLITIGCCFLGATTLSAAAAATGMWDLPELQKAPPVEWGRQEGLVQEIYYPGEPHNGKPTRVFAYLARPSSIAGQKPDRRFPAVVLVHGGGGQAFRAWAELWAKRGYVAVAMDLSGNGPGKVRLSDGGPALSTPAVFTVADTDEKMRDGWTYHAVADVIRAHSVLAALPEVDANRIGITGISWGGYITCIVAGLDPGLKVAVPVYGCGYLYDDSYWKMDFVDTMTDAQRARWIRLCDPSSYLGGVQCPILFINGSNDPRFYLDSHRRSFDLVRPELRNLSIQVGLKHGHIWTIGEVDRFIDAVLKDGPPPPRLGPIEFKDGIARAHLIGQGTKAEFIYARATGPWAERKWTAVPAELHNDFASVKVPEERPLIGYFMVTDAAGFRATTAYMDFKQ